MRSRRWLLGALGFSLCGIAASAAAQEEAPGLAELIQQYERTEQELARARAEMKENPSAAERNRLQSWIQELEAKQEQRAESIEKIIGPLPPKVTQDPLTPLEQQLKAQEQRHETTLESDVEKRLP